MARLFPFFVFASIFLHLIVGSPTIEPALLRKAQRAVTANIIITLKSRPAAVREQISTRSYIRSSDRITDLVSDLQSNAEATQAPIISLLKASKHASTKIKSIWISNQIIVRNVDLGLLEELRDRHDIVSIEQEQPVHLDPLIQLKVQRKEQIEEGEDEEFTTADVSKEWNVDLIQAPLIWAAGYNGSGVLVANIDTGVRATHETLAGNYKNDAYSWFDPYTHAAIAFDDGGHGTHTMATIVGTPETYGVGVAPGAKWIACKGFDEDGLGWPEEMLECGQFILCPHHPDGTDPDCSQAPQVVSNSWNSQEETAVWFNEVLAAWHVAGIIPVHSNGNYGERCCTVGSQAPRRVIAVGATTIDEEIAWFSSRGPTYTNEVKPDISAPGFQVRSAYHGTDSQYAIASGTSMACPHVAGAVALLLNVDPTLSFDRIKSFLQSTTERNLTFTNETCGGRRDSEFPNNQFGYGRLNVFGAYQELMREKSGASEGAIGRGFQLMVLLAVVYLYHQLFSVQ